MSSVFPADTKQALDPTHRADRIAVAVVNQRLKYVSAFDINDKTGW
jgi:hypothetical protein